VGRDGAELAERLRAHLAGVETEGVTAGVVRAQRTSGPVFVFSGHGSQWRGMAADLLASEPAFAEGVARCDEALAPHLGWSVSECLRSGGGPESELDGQILVFAIQVGLAALWRSFGVTPAAVVGHSMGEVAAAHVAGAISLQDAARLIFHRSRALQGLVGRGGMAVVGLPAEQVESLLAGYGDRLCVAVVNSGQSTVVSGEDSAIDELGARMKRDNVFFRRVDAGGPGHSPLAEPLRQQLLDRLGQLRPVPGEVPFYSAVTGGRIAGEQLDEGYWGRNLRQPVRFADAVNALFADGFETFVELSPHPLLLVPIEQEARAAGVDPLVTATLVRGQDGPTAALTALAKLQVCGQPVELSRVTPGRHAQAPTYPWQRQRYWVEPAAQQARQESAHPLIARQLRAIGGGAHYFEGSVSGELFGDQVSEDGVRMVPDGAWLELAIAGAHERGGRGPVTLSQVRLPEPLVLAEGTEQTVQLAMTPDPTAGFEVLTATVDGPARLRAAGRFGGPVPEQPDESATPELDTRFDLPPATRRWLLRPELVEQCLRRSAQLVAEDAELWRAVAVQSVIWHRAPDDRVLLQAWRTAEHTVDIRVSTPAGEPVFALLGVQLGRWHGRRLTALERGRIARLRYQTAWRESSVPAMDVAALAGRWLVLPDRGDVASALAKALAEYGADCELLAPDALEGNGPFSEAIDGRDARGVICLSALGVADDRADEVYGEVAALAQRVSPPVPVWYVTRGAVAANRENSPVEPAQLPVWRLASVAAVERPGSWGGLLDLEARQQEPAADAAAIVAELAATDGEDRIAVRDGQRLVARLTRMPEPEPVRLPWQARPDRSYLVVGRNVGRNVGRDGAVPKSLAQWLAARGARHVLTVSAEELSEPDQVAGLAERLTTAGAPIGGVVWAAVDWSLPEPTALAQADSAAAARTRALGARLLHQQCPDLDLFVVFTGVASEWGAVGASGSAVPDGLLAGLVRERRAAGLTGCCIQWSAWDDPELLDRDSRARLVRSGLEPLPVETAVDVLDQIVADHIGEAQVAQADWGLIVPLYQQALAFPLFADLAKEDTAAADGAGLLDRLRAMPPERQHDELVELVLAELSVVLGLDEADEADPEQGFFAMGVTSITGLEFRLRLERRVGMALPATLVFECPTVAAVVAFLQREALGGPAGTPSADNEPHVSGQADGSTDGGPVDNGPRTVGGPDADDLLARLEDEIAATSALIARRTS
jgi:malonyl CoA-acyl carrier protein transacylase/acyl carrier protein